MDELIKELRNYAADWHNAEVCARAADALTTLQAREATRIRVLRDAHAGFEALQRIMTDICGVPSTMVKTYIERIDEALATSGD